MSIYKREMKDIFDDFISVKSKVQSLASIVQNEGIEVCHHELSRWSEDLNNAINKLSELRLDVFEYYAD